MNIYSTVCKYSEVVDQLVVADIQQGWLSAQIVSQVLVNQLCASGQ